MNDRRKKAMSKFLDKLEREYEKVGKDKDAKAVKKHRKQLNK